VEKNFLCRPLAACLLVEMKSNQQRRVLSIPVSPTCHWPKASSALMESKAASFPNRCFI
jgi:hypothetical protein